MGAWRALKALHGVESSNRDKARCLFNLQICDKPLEELPGSSAHLTRLGIMTEATLDPFNEIYGPVVEIVDINH